MSTDKIAQSSERLQPIVRSSTAQWIRVQAAIEGVSQGEVIDALVEERSKRGKRHE